MNKLLAVCIALGLAFATATRAEGTACDSSCATDHAQCVTRLGDAAIGNCGDSFRMCVQRCDPSRQNAAYLDSAATRNLLASHITTRISLACAGDCSSASRAAVERK